jgi:GntR family transcriptional regulator, vanillate catabolism transcriptional regulator
MPAEAQPFPTPRKTARAALPERRADRLGAQTLKAYAALKDAILQGELPPATRLSEMAMVQRLGVSRTPARMAMMRLREEGIVEPVRSGGFAVRGFSEADVLAAIEIRATLEGLASRFAAERRLSAAQLAPLRDCVLAIGRLVEQAKGPAADGPATYVALNDEFHSLLSDLAACPPLSRQLERASALPFASPSGLVLARAKVSDFRTMLIVAHDQHQGIVEAIQSHDGTRAENLTREHTRLASRNLARVLCSPDALALVPGSALIVVEAADRAAIAARP